jgi:radical SAM-linked protein
VKVRIRFAKTGKVRWTSHRDVARMWERALRRVRLPVAYTEGFSPRPRVSFGLALPTGHESVAEYLDVELAEPDGLDADALSGVLSEALPGGVDVLAAAVLEGRVPSLQHDVTSCSWELEIPGVGQAHMAGRVADTLAASQLLVTRERKGRQVTDDLRAAIISLGILDARRGSTLLGTELATHPRGVRPFELLQAIGPDLEAGRVRRTHQWIERDGARWEPLPPGATHAPHAMERAS